MCISCCQYATDTSSFILKNDCNRLSNITDNDEMSQISLVTLMMMSILVALNNCTGNVLIEWFENDNTNNINY